MARPDDHDIEYVDLAGRTVRVRATAVHRLSVLTDGRGVLYMKDGAVVTISNGLDVRRQLETFAPDCC